MAKILEEQSRTFGEYLLLPGLSTEATTPEKITLRTPLVRYRQGEEPSMRLNIPFVSAIMQSVSNDTLAIALAREGGLAFVYCSQPIDTQAAMVTRVKKYKAGFVTSDTNLPATSTVADVERVTSATGHSTVAITEDGTLATKFLGLVTAIDYHGVSGDTSVTAIMQRVEELKCGTEGMTLTEANTLIRTRRQEALPVLDGPRLKAIVFRKDLREHRENPLEMLDSKKRLMVGAGINTYDYEQRVAAVVDAGADVLCLDSSDGYSVWQAKAIAFVKEKYGGNIKVGAGNVVAADGFEYLADAGADFVKVGIGGGAICITRDQKGLGRGQASAVLDVCAARDAYFKRTGVYIPVCSDGGIVLDYHMIIALSMGVDFLMMGRYFARFDESPTDLVKVGSALHKQFWGEGSNRARNWARYDSGERSTALSSGSKELVFEEGVDSLVPYAGKLRDTLKVTLAKLKSTMNNCGAADLSGFSRNAKLTVVSPLSLQEGTTHDVMVRNSNG